MRLAKSGSISKAQRKVKTNEERSIARIEGVYEKLNLVSELTRKILPHGDCFEKAHKIMQQKIVKKSKAKKGIGQGHGEPKIATVPSLFEISRNISVLRTPCLELRCLCFDCTDTVATK